VPDPVHEPGEPSRPNELPGDLPEEVPVPTPPGPPGPITPPPAADRSAASRSVCPTRFRCGYSYV